MFTVKSISRILSVLLVLVLILSVTPAYAAGILYVTPDGTGDCSTWTAACTLQTALTNATSGDEIWVSAGRYKPTTGTDRAATFQLKNSVAVYGGFDGTEILRDQRNFKTNISILSGDLNGDDVGLTNTAENTYHVVTGATGAILNGFTITQGNANDGITCTNTGCGGGMFNYQSNPTLTNIIFINNSANRGGGMSNDDNSNPSIINVAFINNSAGWGGGGMYNYANSNPVVINTTFNSNLAVYGAGMFNYGSSPNLTNVTFISNSASNYEGGMGNWYGSNSVLTNVTFSNNFAYYGGGGMDNLSSNPQISNAIFWNNSTATGLDQMDNSQSNPVVSDSVIQGGCPIGTICTNIIVADPLLGALGDYGGFTETIPLLSGSSAIDTGNSSTCAATDQRGYIRPVDGDGNSSTICDIGAYEVGAAPLPTQTIIATITVTPTSTETETPTPTFTVTSTETNTTSPTATETPTETATPTVTTTDTLTPTAIVIITNTATLTNTPTSTLMVIPTKTTTKTSTPTRAPLTLISIAAQDGWILESSETSNTGGTINATAGTFQLGDDKANRQYRTVLSFNTAGLPDNAIILSAVLKIKQNGPQVGSNPFNVLSTLWADMRTGPFGSTTLQLQDFSASASANKIGSFNKMPLNGWYLNALNATGRSKINKIGITQFRLYFAKDDNNNFTADYMKFQSGNASSNRPALTITYSLLVNINTASIELLQTLPGIGPTIAQNIVNYRLLYGRYATIDDLLKVPGIGPSLLEGLREFINV